MRLFVYGTLCDADVRELVFGGRSSEALPAALRGYVAVKVISAKYPALRVQPIGCVRGLVLSGVDFATLTRISHYESDEYRVVQRQPVVLDLGPIDALLFLARRNVALSQRRWTLREWQYRHKRRELSRIDSWMAGWRHDNPLDARGLHFACRQIERAGELDFRQVND